MAKEISFEVPDEYPYIMLCCIILYIEIQLIYMCITLRTNMETFDTKFMVQFRV